jgi:hypothetical protein
MMTLTGIVGLGFLSNQAAFLGINYICLKNFSLKVGPSWPLAYKMRERLWHESQANKTQSDFLVEFQQQQTKLKDISETEDFFEERFAFDEGSNDRVFMQHKLKDDDARSVHDQYHVSKYSTKYVTNDEDRINNQTRNDTFGQTTTAKGDTSNNRYTQRREERMLSRIRAYTDNSRVSDASW